MLIIKLQQKKHNFGPKAAPLGAKLAFSELSVTVEAVELAPGDSEGCKEPTAIDKVRRALKDRPAYVEELARATGLAPKTVQNALTELRRLREVEPTGER